MDSLTTDLWIKEIIQKVAVEYNILITEDDPVLITAILNKKLIEDFYEKQKSFSHEYKKEFSTQLACQNKNNQTFISAISEKLIEQVTKKVSKPPTPPTKIQHHKTICGLLFTLGLLLGYIAGHG